MNSIDLERKMSGSELFVAAGNQIEAYQRAVNIVGSIATQLREAANVFEPYAELADILQKHNAEHGITSLGHGWAAVNIGPLRVEYESTNGWNLRVLKLVADLPKTYHARVWLSTRQDYRIPQPIADFLIQRWPVLDELLIQRSGSIEYEMEMRGGERISHKDNYAAVRASDEMRAKIEPYLDSNPFS